VRLGARLIAVGRAPFLFVPPSRCVIAVRMSTVGGYTVVFPLYRPPAHPRVRITRARGLQFINQAARSIVAWRIVMKPFNALKFWMPLMIGLGAALA
jgi:hypothetical protein